jgi:hypothetical protein
MYFTASGEILQKRLGFLQENDGHKTSPAPAFRNMKVLVPGKVRAEAGFVPLGSASGPLKSGAEPLINHMISVN